MTSSPILAASAVVTDDNARFLLVKRGHQPAQGLWSLPGGSVEGEETLVQAAVREVKEETGLDIATGDEVWLVHVELALGRHYEVHAFAATVTGGVLEAGDDADDARWCSVSEFSGLDLTPHLQDFLVAYATAQFGVQEGPENS